MRIAEVIGHVTLSKHHPSVEGARWLVAVPLSLAHLMSRRAETVSPSVGRAEGVSPPVNEELVVYDELGAGLGSLIGISEGTEASMPFRPARKPVDAYAACILDSISVEGIESAAG
jgi:ethanolamine utilization protein EutN